MISNVNDPVWSVIFMVFLSVCMALGYVIYILNIASKEMNNGCYETTEQKELL
jgi:hypothetical protein